MSSYKVCMYTSDVKRKKSTVNVSFREDLLAAIDEVARSESRSRSELLREAARLYIERRKRLSALLDSVRESVASTGLTEADVDTEIQAYRESKR